MSDKYPGGLVTAAAPAGYSVAFDGSGDFLSLASNAAFTVGTGNVTIEAWIYVTSLSQAYQGIISGRADVSPNFPGLGLTIDNSQLLFTILNAGSGLRDSATVPLNQWVHVAGVRSGTSAALFVNGVRKASSTNSENGTSSDMVVGRYYPATNNYYFSGYISNARIVKGTAVYDPTATSINVPTQLFPVTNTSLLTCQSPTIIDNSSNAFAITVNGNAAVSTFTPFPSSYYFYNAPTDGNTRSMVPSNIAGFNPAYGAAAPGVWTLDQAQYFTANRLWPIYDPYFNLTTLMLSGNQPSGVTDTNNNVFKDSSTNNFSITRNGNTTQGTFSPFSQTGWSNYFDGSGDYLSLTISSTTIGSGDFTIEFWYYPTAFQNFDTMFSTTRGANGFNIGTNASASVVWYSSSAEQINSGTLTQNAWNHIAFTRTSNTLRLYVNGSQTGATPTVSTNFSATSCWIGDLATSGSEPSQGYISNLRVVTQSLASGSTYTVSTTPLTAIANTSLLTCQSNRFVDNSTNNFTITRNGDTSIQTFSPFLPTVAYTPQTIGGSGYFDGSGDNLVSASLGTSIGTGDYCLEAWVYTTNAATSFVSSIVLNNSSGYIIYVQISANTIRFLDFQNPGTNFIINGGTINSNEWVHIVATRQSGNMRAFVNGRLAAYQASVNFNYGTAGTVEVPPSVAQYVSQVRVNIGSVPTGYQTSSTTTGTQIFTSPTAPTTTTSQGATAGNVRLLLNMTNAGVVDSTADNVLETVGNAQISTTQSKFGGSSMFFDGSGDYLQIRRTNLLLPVANQDFTFECWVYPTATPGGQGATIMGAGEYGTDDNWNVNINSSLQVSLYIWSANNSYTNTTRTVTVNAWNHIAVSRSGTGTNNLKVFVNGIGQSFSVNNTLVGPVRNFSIGADENGDESVYTGYIDELRFTLGVGRYTADFTPQTSQWQDQ